MTCLDLIGYEKWLQFLSPHYNRFIYFSVFGACPCTRRCYQSFYLLGSMLYMYIYIDIYIFVRSHLIQHRGSEAVKTSIYSLPPSRRRGFFALVHHLPDPLLPLMISFLVLPLMPKNPITVLFAPPGNTFLDLFFFFVTIVISAACPSSFILYERPRLCS